MKLTIELLRELCQNRQVLFSVHSLERLQERGIYRKDIVNVIMMGEIIEDYPDDYPYPSCLIFGASINNQILHVICGCNGEFITIITAYYPTTDKFEADLKTRKELKQ